MAARTWPTTADPSSTATNSIRSGPAAPRAHVSRTMSSSSLASRVSSAKASSTTARMAVAVVRGCAGRIVGVHGSRTSHDTRRWSERPRTGTTAGRRAEQAADEDPVQLQRDVVGPAPGVVLGGRGGDGGREPVEPVGRSHLEEGLVGDGPGEAGRIDGPHAIGRRRGRGARRRRRPGVLRSPPTTAGPSARPGRRPRSRSTAICSARCAGSVWFSRWVEATVTGLSSRRRWPARPGVRRPGAGASRRRTRPRHGRAGARRRAPGAVPGRRWRCRAAPRVFSAPGAGLAARPRCPDRARRTRPRRRHRRPGRPP